MKKIIPCIIGLGYVGLPLFVSLKKNFQLVGYDIDEKRVKELKKKYDRNNEFNSNDLKLYGNSVISSNHKDIKKSNFYIITVPTPIKKDNSPDLKFVKSAFNTISKYIKEDDIIILESTVYPGTTLEICKSILKKKNKKKKFYIGYSSERINPGDKIHNIKNISKVVSIDADEKINALVKNIYKNVSKKIIFTRKIYEAELSKLIENTQRDLNIGLMNELMILCEKAKLDFSEVIRLANTKWNFLKFKPGLVGGHCLPVDPHYLSYFAEKLKFKTQITLAARRTNDYMEQFIQKKIILELKKKDKKKTKKIFLLGLTYKPNVPDYRNSLAINIYKRLKKVYKKILVYDPVIEKTFREKNQIKHNFRDLKNSDIFILLVKHKQMDYVINYARKNKKILIDPLKLI